MSLPTASLILWDGPVLLVQPQRGTVFTVLSYRCLAIERFKNNELFFWSWSHPAYMWVLRLHFVKNCQSSQALFWLEFACIFWLSKEVSPVFMSPASPVFMKTSSTCPILFLTENLASVTGIPRASKLASCCWECDKISTAAKKVLKPGRLLKMGGSVWYLGGLWELDLK